MWHLDILNLAIGTSRYYADVIYNEYIILIYGRSEKLRSFL